MTTGATFADPAFKKLLTNEDFKERMLSYLREYVREHMAKAWQDDGVFGTSKMTLGGTSADTVTVVPVAGSSGTDGDGHLLELGTGADVVGIGQIKAFKIENTLGFTYYVGYKFCEIPSGIVINPRSGFPQYTNNVEGIGVRDVPDAITDNGNGTLTANINSVCEVGHSYAGRKALVFMNTPVRGATSEAIAIELCTVTWNGVNNRITTVGALGQTTISTQRFDYNVILLGPHVSKGDLSSTDATLFIGSVAGVGAGVTPGAGVITNQNLIDQSLSSLVAYDGGPNWADGTTNPATTVGAQLDKIISDLTSTTGQRGAGKLTSPALSAWADGTTNPATRLDLQLDKIISDLTTTSGNGGLARVGVGARSNWLDAVTNPAATAYAALNKIITDLALTGAGNDGTGKIGAKQLYDATSLPAEPLVTHLSRLFMRQRFAALGNFQRALCDAPFTSGGPEITGIAVKPDSNFFGTSGPVYVAVAGGGAAAGVSIIFSQFGDDQWQLAGTIPASHIYNDVVGVAALDLVAVGPSSKIASSPDGDTWTSRTSQITGTLERVIYGALDGKFVCIGNSQAQHSTDGHTWTGPDVTFSALAHGITEVPTGGGGHQYVVVGEGILYTSPTTAVWTDHSSLIPGALSAAKFRDVVYDPLNNIVIAAGEDGKVMTSLAPNITTSPWTNRSSGLPLANGEGIERLRYVGDGIVVGGIRRKDRAEDDGAGGGIAITYDGGTTWTVMRFGELASHVGSTSQPGVRAMHYEDGVLWIGGVGVDTTATAGDLPRILRSKWFAPTLV